jgi:hypothetical protein
MLQPAAEIVVVRGREKADMTWVRMRYSQATTETSLSEMSTFPHQIKLKFFGVTNRCKLANTDFNQLIRIINMPIKIHSR